MNEDLQNILFSGKITLSKKNINEYINTFYKKLLILLTVVTVLTLTASGISSATTSSYTSFFMLCFLFAVVLFIFFLRVKMEKKILYSRTLEQNGGTELMCEISFTDSGIASFIPYSGNKLNHAYDTVKRVATSKNLLIIVTKAKAAIIIEKESIDNLTGCLSFLKEKMSVKR